MEGGGLGHLQRHGGSKQGVTEEGHRPSSCPIPYQEPGNLRLSAEEEPGLDPGILASEYLVGRWGAVLTHPVERLVSIGASVTWGEEGDRGSAARLLLGRREGGFPCRAPTPTCLFPSGLPATGSNVWVCGERDFQLN